MDNTNLYLSIKERKLIWCNKGCQNLQWVLKIHSVIQVVFFVYKETLHGDIHVYAVRILIVRTSGEVESMNKHSPMPGRKHRLLVITVQLWGVRVMEKCWLSSVDLIRIYFSAHYVF